MPELGCDQFLKKRAVRAAGNGNVAALCERHHTQSVIQSHLQGDVAWNDGDRSHIQFRRIQCQHNGERVVGSWVGVDDYLLGGCCRYGECCNQEGDEWKVEWTDANVARSHYRWNCH